MGICFIFLIFGLSVSAEEEDLRGYQSMQNESTAFKTTSSSEEQDGSTRSDGNVPTERSALLTTAVIGSPGTDLFHAPYDTLHSSRVNTTTTTDKDAITANGARFVSVYGTDSLFMSVNSTAEKRLQSRGDLLLISNDEGSIRTSAETEFESMMNDTMTPSAHLSRGREKILAFFHGSTNGKNQTVLDSITFSPANGIPMVSTSDPAVIDNLGESDENVERRSENRNENWTMDLLRTSDPQKSTEPIQVDEVSLKKIHTIMQFTVLQDKGLLTTLSSSEFKTGQRSEQEPKKQKNLTSSLVLNQPLQVKSTSQMVVNKMIESSKNNRPQILGVPLNGPNEKHPNAMLLFSTSKLTPTNTPASTMLNYYLNTVISAAGKVHVTKQFAAPQLISDDLPKSISARDTLENKLIFHTESSKERHFKQTLPFQTSTRSFLHRLNKSNVGPPHDIFSATQNSLSSQSDLLQTLDFHTKAFIETRTPNVSVIEKHNGIDHVPVLLSKLKAFNTASFTTAEEASTADDKRILIQKTQSLFSAFPTLLPQVNTSKHLSQFEKLSTVSPVTKPQIVFHVSRVNNYSLIKQSQTHLPSETSRFFVLSPPERRPKQATVDSSERMFTQSSFTSVNVKRFTNIQNLTEFFSTNQNRENSMSQTVSSLISQRPNISMSTEIFTVNETVNSTTELTSLFIVPLVVLTPQTSNSSVSRTSSVTSAWATESLITHLSLEPQVSVADRLLSSHATSRKFLTPFSKSQNIVTTDVTVLSKLLGVGKNSNSETIFFNHPLKTENLGFQDPKNPKGTEMIFFRQYTVTSIPSVEQLSKPPFGEASLTATLPSQSKVQTESYLNKRDRKVKPTTQSSSSVVDMNQTSLKSILHNIVSLSQNVGPINSASVSPSVLSIPEFKQDLTFAALFETPRSSEQAMTQPSVPHFTVHPITPVLSSRKDSPKDSFLTHQVLANSTDVQEHPQNMASRQISGITESLNRHKTNTTAVTQTGGLTTSPSPLLELSAGTTSPALPLFQMQTVLHKKHLTLSENQTEFSTTVNGHSQTTQPNVPSYEKYSSGTTEDQKLFGQTALSAVTVDEFSHIYPMDLSFSSTKAQMLPKGSLQTSGGSEDVSHGATPYAESDSEKATDFVSDLPVINRRRRIILPDSLSGIAQISDDICGTGNYTAEMSLNLERDIMPGDLIPALGNLRVVINLKTNNSHADLEIKSCCLSPTVRLDEFNTTCCIFSEQATDPHAIRLLPSVPSQRATFTIRLFQMINYSSAYLHCDLSVCLRNHSECERQCAERRNALPVDRAGAIFGSKGNRISFGPVLKGSDNSSTETAADTEAAVVIISSVAGCLLACLALLLVWMNRRCLERSVCCWSRALCEC